MNSYAKRVLENLQQTNGNEKEFIQSVTEVFESLGDVLEANPKYEANKILERMVVPERVIMFPSNFTPGYLSEENEDTN